MMSISENRAPSDLLRFESILDQFENDLRQGNAAPLNSYCKGFAESDLPSLTCELIKIEWDFLLESKTAPVLDDYKPLGLLPDHELERLFDQWKRTQDVPTKIGPFQLTQKLGSGSFGTVWKAFDNRLQREVALKVAHAHFFDDTDRFLREAKAAARLSHPCIVKILDAGKWEERLCIVQEYVSGSSLDEEIKKRRPTPYDAADLCLSLSEALAYSHRHGCIHRDIKLQNIIVQSDGSPVLIDFGLAKNPTATHGTRSGEIIGTPACMSPEQARGASHLADARSDIYSLGVILFQLLTGELPFRGSFEMILLQVLTQDPPHPRKLNREIPADLATICLKCLEKEPRRRYASAGELSDDLRRFLDGKSVKARPVTTLYRAYRTTIRNPVPSALILTLALAIAFVFVQSIQSARRARVAWHKEARLRQDAVEAKQLAEGLATQAQTEARLAQQVTRFMEEVFSLDDPIGNHAYSASNFAGVNVNATELLSRAVYRIDKELAEQPRVQLRLLDIIANSYRSMGDFEQAKSLLNRADTLRIAIAKDHPEWNLDRETAAHLFYQGWMHQSLGNYELALEELTKSRHLYERFLEPDNLKIADIHFQLGWLHLEWRQSETAIQQFDEALRIRRKHLPDSHRLVWSTQLGRAFCNTDATQNIMSVAMGALDMKLDPQLAMLAYHGGQIISARKLGDNDEAERVYRKVMPMLKERLSEDHYVYLLCAGDFASLLLEQGNYVEALDYIEPAIERGRQLAPGHPHLIHACKKLGFEKMLAGRHREAKQLFKHALDRIPPEARIHYDFCTFQIANCIALEEFEEADQLFQRITIPENRPEPRAWYLSLKAKTFRGLGRLEEAEQLEQQAWVETERATMSYQAAIWLSRFAEIYRQCGDDESAEALLRQAIERCYKFRPKDHPRTADPQFDLGQMLVQQSRFEEALQLLNESLRIRQEKLPPSDLRIAQAKKWIAKAEQGTTD